MLKKGLVSSFIGILIVAAPSGCDRKNKSEATGDGSKPAAAAALPSGLFVSNAPSGAVNVAKARNAPQRGDSITLKGRIGGRKDPFVTGRAVFTLVDVNVKTCAENPGDSCPTPWDYCCEPADLLTKNSATIQVADAQGRPLHADLRGRGGLEPLAVVTVKGKIASVGGGDILIVNAEAIHVK